LQGSESSTEQIFPELGEERVSIQEPSPSLPQEEAAPAISRWLLFLACALAYLIPGAGHIILGRWIRGLLCTISIFAMFALGMWMQGHLFIPNSNDWLSVFPAFANAGMGATYFICWYSGYGLEIRSDVLTFEYGNTFLLVAGLLNYLVVLDAFDIGVGRKR